jgi:hypothetical protein
MNPLRIVVATLLFFLLGATAPAFAQEQHEEKAKPAPHQGEMKPAPHPETAAPAPHQDAKRLLIPKKHSLQPIRAK